MDAALKLKVDLLQKGFLRKEEPCRVQLCTVGVKLPVSMSTRFLCTCSKEVDLKLFLHSREGRF